MTILQDRTAVKAAPAKRRVARRVAKWATFLIAISLAPALWSYGHALTRPGPDSAGIRTTEWVKDHGGKGLVAWAERVWYEHHAPKRGGVPAAKDIPAVTAPSLAAPAITVPVMDQPVPPKLIVAQPLPGEGVWQPGPLKVDGVPAVYTTFIQPSTQYTSLVTGLAWMDPHRLRFSLYAGSQQPGGTWPLMAPLPLSVRPSLAAAFNSGFKLADSHGGFYDQGVQARPLVNGQASLIISTNGMATVGMWGRDAQMGPTIEAVRQNLVLLIDNGQEAPDLDHDSLARWGFTPGNKTFVWRSGVGVDAQGDLIYAAGMLTVHALADVMHAAGAVRAMELDINSQWVHFFTYGKDASAPDGVGGGKLVPQMTAGPDLYFKPSERDFIAAFAR